MRLYPILESFSRGPKVGPGRGPAIEPFPFQERLPLKLKNSVSSKGEKSAEVACLQEMTVLFACFKKHDFNQALCSKEIQTFGKCYDNFTESKRIKKAQDKKGILASDSKKLSYRQINQILAKYPDNSTT